MIRFHEDEMDEKNTIEIFDDSNYEEDFKVEKPRPDEEDFKVEEPRTDEEDFKVEVTRPDEMISDEVH